MNPELKDVIKAKIDHHIEAHQSIVDDVPRFRTNITNNVLGIMRIMLDENDPRVTDTTLAEIVETFNSFTNWDVKIEEGSSKLIYPWNGQG